MDNIPSFVPRSARNRLSNISISIEQVWEQLCRLKPTKSCGPDNIHPRVLREVKEGVVFPLHLIFQKSLTTGILPAIWKEANVTALYKKGDRCVPNNYRPISLTSVVCKMLKSIIKDEFFRHFDLNNLFTAYQHGFRPGYSCVMQLINVMKDWTHAIECGKSVDVIYLDYSKAFDRVPHARLISNCLVMGLMACY